MVLVKSPSVTYEETSPSTLPDSEGVESDSSEELQRMEHFSAFLSRSKSAATNSGGSLSRKKPLDSSGYSKNCSDIEMKSESLFEGKGKSQDASAASSANPIGQVNKRKSAPKKHVRKSSSKNNSLNSSNILITPLSNRSRASSSVKPMMRLSACSQKSKEISVSNTIRATSSDNSENLESFGKTWLHLKDMALKSKTVASRLKHQLSIRDKSIGIREVLMDLGAIEKALEYIISDTSEASSHKVFDIISKKDNDIQKLSDALSKLEKNEAFAQKTLDALIQENALLKSQIRSNQISSKSMTFNPKIQESSSSFRNRKISEPFAHSQILSGPFPPKAVGRSNPPKTSMPGILSDEDNDHASDHEDIDYNTVLQFEQNDEFFIFQAQKNDSYITVTEKVVKNVSKHLIRKNNRGKYQISLNQIRKIIQVSQSCDKNYQFLPKIRHLSHESEEVAKEVAAIKIQSVYRGYIARKTHKNIILRKMIAKEILETELSYVDGLLDLYKNYYVPLNQKSVLGRPIIADEQLEIIFYHLKEIMRLNGNILAKLNKRIRRWNKWEVLGDIFIQFTPNLQMYTHYVTNYNRALLCLQQCQECPRFRNFQSEIYSKKGRRCLALEDLLITPIQRIPRYVLLLKSILKHTEDSHPDYSELGTAISQLQQVATVINEKKRESENRASDEDTLSASGILRWIKQ